MGSEETGTRSTRCGGSKRARPGPEPASATVELWFRVQPAVLMAMGADPELANADPATGTRQAACRSFLTGSAFSFARMATRESRRMLERPVRLRFAADADNRRPRSAAVKSLVNVEVSLERALRLAGFDFE